MKQGALGVVGMYFSPVLYNDSDFLLEMCDLYLRDCDHVRADPAEVRVLDLAVVTAFESDLLDGVEVILQKFFVSWIVGPFCELNFIQYFLFTLGLLRNAGQLNFVYLQLVVLSEHSDKGLFIVR